jgi:L-threonylcarbamoyladenylate synthase
MIGSDLELAAKFLINNELVAIPTETVYGLAGNAFSENAVLKIFETKQRPSFDPLIVHTHSIEKIKDFVIDIPDLAFTLLSKFTPGPLTILLPKKSNIPDLVTSGLPRVAVRIPNHSISLDLLKHLDFPLAAPSANPFGYISPTKAKHVQDQLGDKIPYILDGGDSNIGLESTIIGFEEDKTIIYRLGGLSVDEIQKVTGKVEIRMSSSSPAAPGMLKSHYAPQKKLLIGNIPQLMKSNFNKIGVLSFSDSYNIKNEYILSQNGNINEAAKNLFSMLRSLDENSEVEIILAEYVPNIGLGLAINDRLKRAAF